MNEADIVGRDVVAYADGSFIFFLDATWRLKSDPAWVTVQATQAGQFNVRDVAYYPEYLLYQSCDDSYVFTCEGKLINTAFDGNVTTQFDAGLAPNHAGDLEATFIPKP